MNQQQALDILKLGHNVYLTGQAGSGKTYLLNSYIDYLKAKGVGVGITASTGIAATHMNGMTIHSWSGLGIKDELKAKDLLDMAKKRRFKSRFDQTKVLIIDEVSMLHAHQLDLVDLILKSFKQSLKAFGGLQVILCGDFFQLPPVARGGIETQFVDKSEVWQNMALKVCYLDEQFRQEDEKLLKILYEIRQNSISPTCREYLAERLHKPTENFPTPTKLYTHNVDVDMINIRELAELHGKTYNYTMESLGNTKLTKSLKKSCLAPERLSLKKGAVVMFVKNNFEVGYVNGTLGEVIDFDEDNLPIIKTTTGKYITATPEAWAIEEDGLTRAKIRQIPLRLAWAITVHKSQGMTLEAAEIDLSKTFERGMGYVALSRVKSLRGMKLMGLNEMALAVNEEVLRSDENLKKMSIQSIEEIEKITPEDKEAKQNEYLKSIVPQGPRPKKPKRIPGETYQETKKLIEEKLPLAEIAKRRGLKEKTIVDHLEKIRAKDKNLDIDYLKPPADRLKKILDTFRETEDTKMTPVKEILGDDYSYDEIKLGRLFLEW